MAAVALREMGFTTAGEASHGAAIVAGGGDDGKGAASDICGTVFP